MVKAAAALFGPDRSRYDMAYSGNIMNALPVAGGYMPMPSPADQNPLIRSLVDEDGIPLVDEDGNVLIEFITGSFDALTDSMALPEASRGGIFVRLEDGSTRLFVGTQTKLWQFDFTGNFWSDVSGASAPYACDDRWYFFLYGSTIYCGDNADSEQMFEIGVDTVFEDNPSAPIASDGAVVGDFAMRAVGNSVQWSALNDPTSNSVGIRFSDVQPFGDGNGVQRILPVSSGAIIIQRDKFEVLTYPDPDYVFRRSQLNGYRGSPAKWSAVLIGQDDFTVYCQDGFFRGPNMQPIGAELVDRYILEVCDETARQNMVGAADFGRKIVVYRVQKSDLSYLLLIYNWQLNQWSQSDADLADPLRLETVGLTIGQLDSVFPTIADLADVTWGSEIFDGGALVFGGVTSQGYLAMLTGPPMEATLETNEASINGTNRAFVNGGRLDGDAANCSVVLYTSDYKGQAFRARNAVSPSARTRFLPLRGDGRVHKATVTIPSGEPWTIYQGVDLDAAGSGKS